MKIRKILVYFAITLLFFSILPSTLGYEKLRIFTPTDDFSGTNPNQDDTITGLNSELGVSIGTGAYLKFDISALPDNIDMNYLNLMLHFNSISDSGRCNVLCFSSWFVGWDEETITYDDVSDGSQSLYSYFLDRSNKASGHSVDDKVNAPEIDYNRDPGWITWWSIPEPEQRIFTLVLYGFSGNTFSSDVTFSSKDASTNKPKLCVYYTDSNDPDLGEDTYQGDSFDYDNEYTFNESMLRTEELKVLPTVMKYAKQYHVSPALIMAVIRQESDFRSDVGTQYVGYMQVGYEAASDKGMSDAYTGSAEEWLTDGKDLDTNIKYGTRYLSILNSIFDEGKVLTSSLSAIEVSEIFSRMHFVLAAYNGGPGRISSAQNLAEPSEAGNWWSVQQYLEEAGASSEKAEEIRDYVNGVLFGRDEIDGMKRGHQFFLLAREFSAHEPGDTSDDGGQQDNTQEDSSSDITETTDSPGFELIFVLLGFFVMLYINRQKKEIQ